MRPAGPTASLWAGIAGLVAFGFVPDRARQKWEWPPFASSRSFHVVSGADAGRGTLRQALIDAAQSPKFARIHLTAPVVTIETPLPPVVSAAGLEIVADSESELDARALGTGAVLDILTPRTTIRNLKITGAADAAIRVRSEEVRIEGVHVRSSLVGIDLVGPTADVLIRGVSLEDNGTGVRLSDKARATVRDSKFRAHGEAAIWYVSPPLTNAPPETRLTLDNCAFQADRIGVVALNESLEIVDTRFEGASIAGLLLDGPARIARSRVTGGAIYGVLIEPGSNVSVESTEIDHNAVGIRVAEGPRILVTRNTIHNNIMGIVTLFGGGPAPELSENTLSGQASDAFYILGSSPTLSANRILGNAGAAFRLVDYVVPGLPVRRAEPTFEGNSAIGNGINEPARGTFEVPAAEKP